MNEKEENEKVELPITNEESNNVKETNEEVKMEVPSKEEAANANAYPTPSDMPQVAPQPQSQNNNQTSQFQNPYIQTPNNGTANAGVNPPKKMDIKIIIAICGAGVIFILLILLLLLNSGSKGVVKKYSKYYVKGDYQKIVELYHEEYDESYKKYNSDGLKSVYKDKFKDRKDDDIVYKKYKIVDKIKASKDELDDIKDSLEKSFDIDEKDVKSVEVYLIKYKIDNDGEIVYSYGTVTTCKVKGKWYIFSNDGDSTVF